MMKMKMILIRSGRRNLHTIISHETIKPSSPTPSHLQTYNFSKLDLLNPRAHIPFVLFYPKTPDSSSTPQTKLNLLKKSLSQTLTRHYPFAGRLPTPITPSHVDCNDAGVTFTEATNDNRLETFRRMTGQDEALAELFADGIVHTKPVHLTDLVRVQVNHFSCGGLALAISMSHLIGDACSLASFVNHWASVARHGSIDHEQVRTLDPYFVQNPRHSVSLPPESRTPASAPAFAPASDMIQLQPCFVARRFTFPNSKLSDLKNKISVKNPTRVEVLSSLLYKTAMETATGGFKPATLFFMVNMRSKFVKKLPETTIGNFVSLLVMPTVNETSLTTMVSEIKKQKLKFEGIQSVDELVQMSELVQAKGGNQDNVAYFGSSFCGFPFSRVDFGWGKPVGTTLATKSTSKNGFVLMDSSCGDGIEALVMLEEHHMKTFENDKEMLSFCQTN